MSNINYDEALKFYIKNLRQNRNQLLTASDKYVLPDYPIVSSNLELVKTYRQQLGYYMNTDQVINYN